MNLDEARTELLLSGLDDWVSLAEASSLVSDYVSGDSPSELREATLVLVSELLTSGLVEPGELRGDFVPWELDDSSSMVRIRAEWEDQRAHLLPGDICWFRLTPRGRKLGDEAWAVAKRQEATS